ncbi:MAG: T9SS type A sorting domain-containing protein [Cytophagaceae bacterium]
MWRLFKSFFFVFLIPMGGYTQSVWYQNSVVTIAENTTLYVNGTYQLNNTLNNGGTINVTKGLQNDKVSPAFSTPTGKVYITGSNPVTIQGDWNFHYLHIQKSADSIKLLSNISVDSILHFENGMLNLNNHVIQLGSTGSLENESSASRIVPSSGYVEATRVLMFPTISENIAGLGIYVEAPTHNFSNTTIRRFHQPIPDINNGSIPKVWEVLPAVAGPVDAVETSYFLEEAVGDEDRFQQYVQSSTSSFWLPKGGVVNTSLYEVINTTFAQLVSQKITIAASSSGASCLLSDPNYIEAVFLVPSNANQLDTVYMYSLPPVGVNGISYSWNLGDGNTTVDEDLYHIYTVPGSYDITYQISNGICYDVQIKTIQVEIPPPMRTAPNVLGGIVRSMNVYPNPVPNNLYVELELEQSLESSLVIQDARGHVVYRAQSIQDIWNTSIDTSGFPVGFYTLFLQVADKKFIYKIIKE